MSHDTGLDLVTGAFSYSGSRIAERLLNSGRAVRTLTFHPDRPHRLQSRVQTMPYCFDGAVALAGALEGVNTLYNTYWSGSTTAPRRSPTRFPTRGRCSTLRGVPGSSGSFTSASRTRRSTHRSLTTGARRSSNGRLRKSTFPIRSSGRRGSLVATATS